MRFPNIMLENPYFSIISIHLKKTRILVKKHDYVSIIEAIMNDDDHKTT